MSTEEMSTIQPDDLIRKLAVLQEKLEQGRDRVVVTTAVALIGGTAAATVIIDKLLDTAIWAVDRYYTVPPSQD